MSDLLNPVKVKCLVKVRKEDGSTVILEGYSMTLYGHETSRAMQMLNFERDWIEKHMIFDFERIAVEQSE